MVKSGQDGEYEIDQENDLIRTFLYPDESNTFYSGLQTMLGIKISEECVLCKNPIDKYGRPVWGSFSTRPDDLLNLYEDNAICIISRAARFSALCKEN